jgi:predicted CoA-binding protein
MTKEQKMETTAVIGASPIQDRDANKAMRLLADHNHRVIPVAPRYETIEGRKVYPSLAQISETIDTVTLYVGPARQAAVIREIIQTAPRRVIFNPGTENPEAYAPLKAAGIEVVEACTLVLLKTNQY